MSKRLRQAVAGAALLALSLAGVGHAETGNTGAQVNYKDAQFVQVNLAEQNVEKGIRLVEGQPDGGTRPVPESGGRQSVAVQAGTERFFYFDVHETYINGGKNQVIMTVQYMDTGLLPFYLEYDSFDPYRPGSAASDVVKKRVLVASRSNSEALKTAYITLQDARFANWQLGGADFRIGSTDDLVLHNVSVLRVSHQEPLPPIQILLNGKLLSFDRNDVQPFVHPQTSRTLVPFRAIFNALGVSNEDIAWDNATRTITAKKGKTIIVLTIDSKVASVNYVPVELDQAPTIIGGRTVVPLRFVAERFGLTIPPPRWTATERVITLTGWPEEQPLQVRP